MTSTLYTVDNSRHAASELAGWLKVVQEVMRNDKWRKNDSSVTILHRRGNLTFTIDLPDRVINVKFEAINAFSIGPLSLKRGMWYKLLRNQVVLSLESDGSFDQIDQSVVRSLGVGTEPEKYGLYLFSLASIGLPILPSVSAYFKSMSLLFRKTEVRHELSSMALDKISGNIWERCYIPRKHLGSVTRQLKSILCPSPNSSVRILSDKSMISFQYNVGRELNEIRVGYQNAQLTENLKEV